MESVRQQLLSVLPAQIRDLLPAMPELGPDNDIAVALQYILPAIDEGSPDDWTFFRIVQESQDSLNAVGLMGLLEGGTIPIDVSVRTHEDGLAWSAFVARQDRDWLGLSESQQWKRVYRYATGEEEEPRWTWAHKYQGVVRRARA